MAPPPDTPVGSVWRRASLLAAVTGTEPLSRTAAVATAGATTDMFFQATLARSFISTLKLRGDDDVVDRLNYYYTPIMLAIACLVVSAKQFGGSPIECWVNPHSRESMEEYIEAFCWIQNTYWVPMYEHIPDSHETREGQQIGYYQWVPFILIAQALAFSLPCILWRLLNWQNGTNIHHLISAAEGARTVLDQNEREKVFHALALTFTEMIDLRETEYCPHPAASIFTRFRPTRLLKGQLISCLYLFIKCFYTANILLQFSLLNAALKSDEYLFYGFQVISDLFEGKAWTKSGHFPRYTVQCALLINIINEKVFTFFWLWYCLLLCITTCSTLFWLTNILLHAAKVDYILRFMQIAENSCQFINPNIQSTPFPQRARIAEEEGDYLIEGGGHSFVPFRVPNQHGIDKFVDDFLKSDGLFILRMIANHAGELAVVGIVKHLWNIFSSRQFNYRPFIFQNEINNHLEEEKQQIIFPHHQTTIYRTTLNVPPKYSNTLINKQTKGILGINSLLGRRRLKNNNVRERRSTEADIFGNKNSLSSALIEIGAKKSF
uniref:Innexin n=1 Tax=Meloidogyne floridensis TaxID=298350 RepID=A0A915NVZ3_9BILA